jgi:hypothetical protein
MTTQTYEGTHCKAAGHVLRYAATGACILCARLAGKHWRAQNKDRDATYKRAYHTKNRTAILKRTAEWRTQNPDKYAAQNARKYGRNIAADKAARDDHDGKCAVCETTVPGGKGWHVDHVHDGSGDVRGLLCHFCNLGIGHLKDSADLADKAAAYLRSPVKYKAPRT